MTDLQQSRQELESRLIAEASQNPAFRQRLLDDPNAALSDFLGMALPPGMNVTVLEEQPGQHYLVLPPATPDLDALLLGDLELALVGGGRTLRPGYIGGEWDRKLSKPRDSSSTSARRSSC